MTSAGTTMRNWLPTKFCQAPETVDQGVPATTIETEQVESAKSAVPEVQCLGGKHLSFLLAGEAYGVSVLSVREIIALQDITPLPSSPSYVEGVINLRGRIIPVADLRKKLNVTASEATRKSCIVVIDLVAGDQSEVMHVGCIVDSVIEILDLVAEEIEPPPSLGQDTLPVGLKGLITLGDSGRVVTLLDVNQLLAGMGSIATEQLR